MSFGWRIDRREKTRWMIWFLIGFLPGIVLVCLWPQQLVFAAGFLDMTEMNSLKHLTVNQNGLFLYAMQQRLKTAAFLVLLSAAGMIGIASGIFVAWCGLSVGMVLTVLSLRYGFKGLLFFIGSMLPQQLFLVPGFLMLLDWCCRRQEARRLLIPLLIVIIGCFLESYINPTLLKLVLHLF